MRIVCLGDSLTYGYGVHFGENWVELIKRKFKLDIINKGVNGDTTAGMLSRSFKDVLEEKPSHAIIMAGTNDLLLGYRSSMLQDNIRLLAVEARNHGINPIIAIQPPIYEEMAREKWDSSTDYHWVNEELMAYRKWTKEHCNEFQTQYIDFYKAFKEIDKIGSLSEYYIDGLHPTSKGHRLMADTIDKRLFT